MRNPLSFLRSIFEKQEAVIVPVYKRLSGEFPPLRFAELRDYYAKDADFYAAVNFIASRALSKGYHITTDPDGDSNEESKEFLEDWIKTIPWGDKRNEKGLTPLLRIIIREMCWGGTSILEMIDPDNIEKLSSVQLSSIWRFQRDEFGNLTAIWQFPSINPEPLDPARYIIFAWNVVDRNPFGYGLIHAAAQYKTDFQGNIVPPLVLRKWQIENDIGRIIHRYGTPRSIFSFKGLNEDDIKQYAEILKDPDTDASFATNAEVDIKTDHSAATPRHDVQLEYLDTRIQASLQTPLIRLLTSSGFTEASSKVASELGDIIVWDIQQVVKLNIEKELFDRVLTQNGYDANLVKAEFNWGIPDKPEFKTQDVLNAFQSGLIGHIEGRKILQKLGWEVNPEDTESDVQAKPQLISKAPPSRQEEPITSK